MAIDIHTAKQHLAVAKALFDEALNIKESACIALDKAAADYEQAQRWVITAELQQVQFLATKSNSQIKMEMV